MVRNRYLQEIVQTMTKIRNKYQDHVNAYDTRMHQDVNFVVKCWWVRDSREQIMGKAQESKLWEKLKRANYGKSSTIIMGPGDGSRIEDDEKRCFQGEIRRKPTVLPHWLATI
jgi:hypothetical protein